MGCDGADSLTGKAMRAAIAAVTREHVFAALERIRRDGIPPRRHATKYALMHDGVRYPPKYALSLAAEAVTGRPLPPEAHSGGRDTNSILEGLGFSIILVIPGP